MMAYQASISDSTPESQLFFQLKQEFPYMSNEIIRNCMKECSYRHEQSKELLSYVSKFNASESSNVQVNNINAKTYSANSPTAETNLPFTTPTRKVSRPNYDDSLVEKTVEMKITNDVNRFNNYPCASEFSFTNAADESNNPACSPYNMLQSPNSTNASQLTDRNNQDDNNVVADGIGYNQINYPHYQQNRIYQQNRNYQLQLHSESSTNDQYAAQAASPPVVRCDMQVRYRPSFAYNQTPHANVSSAQNSPINNQTVDRSPTNVPRHISHLYMDPQLPHLHRVTQPASNYMHSTSVNYVITPTTRQSLSTPPYQPLHVVTESTGGGVTAISTNVRPNNQHGYSYNTAIPSPQLRTTQHGMYNPATSVPQTPQHLHGGQIVNNTISPRPSHNLPEPRPMPNYNFPPDVSTKREDDHLFKQALIQRQKSRFEHLRSKLQAKTTQLLELRAEVNSMETELLQKQSLSDVFSQSQLKEIPALRQENRNLKIKCQCIAWDVDLHSGNKNGDFFSQLNTGRSMPKTNNEHRNPPASAIRAQPEENDGRDKQWHCVKCTFLNSQLMDKCEMCTMIRIPEAGASGMHQ